jgi:hypothetical protein
MPAHVLVLKGFFENMRFEIPEGTSYTVGRGPGNSLQLLHDKKLSRRHCEITLSDDGTQARLRDLDSAYGTKIGSESIKEAALNQEDHIVLAEGEVELTFHFGKDAIDGSTVDIPVPHDPLGLDDDDDLLFIGDEIDESGPAGPATIPFPSAQEAAQGGPNTLAFPGASNAALDEEGPETLAFPAAAAAASGEMAALDPPEGWIGREIASYEIAEYLGEGTFGRVYRANHDRMGRPAAFRLLNIERNADPSRLNQFLQSARMISQAAHPSMISLYDAGQAQGCYYMAVEYVNGPALWRRVEDRGPLDLATALSIARQVCEALVHLHSQGACHMRVHAGNVLLGPDGDAKLTDLGLRESLKDKPDSRALRGPNAAFLAPEILDGTGSPASDLYGLGAVLYFALSGSPPIPSDAPHLAEAIRSTTPRPLDAGVPEAITDLIDRLLAKAPGDRPASASEVLDSLQYSL